MSQLMMHWIRYIHSHIYQYFYCIVYRVIATTVVLCVSKLSLGQKYINADYFTLLISRLMIVSRGAKKKQAVRNE